MKPLVLCILDGVGIRKEKNGNAVYEAKMPNFDNLMKKYPHIKMVYDRVKELENVICSNDRRLMELRDRKEIMKRKLAGAEDQLNRKKEELNNEEEKYFNSLVDKTIVTEDGKQFIVGSVGKVKSKVKLLEDK